jgi:predicted nucleotide-binding protein
VRFTRHATELTYDPEKFISIDTEIDILEIRVPEPLNRQQRELIIKTTHTILVSHDVKTSLTEDNKQQTPKDPKKIFVVHGHHTEMRLAVSLMLTKLHLKPVILGERVNQGKTIIEKFEANSDVGFAVVLMSADDMAYLKTSDPSTALPRPRQNVIFELGFFIAKLDRVKIAILKEDIPELEILTDLSGIAYISYKDDWQNQLFRELEAAGYDIDARNLI